MMKSVVIRPAEEKDLPVLADLKATYMRTCYDGYAPSDVLSRITGENYIAEFTAWLASPDYWIDVLEADGAIESYMVYRLDGEDSGWILEARTTNPCDAERHRMLLDRVAGQLREKGCAWMRTWLPRSNYRKRFLYEGYGFRANGERRQDERHGHTYEMVQYRCEL